MFNIRNFIGIIDIILILLFVIMIYRGWTKGFLDLLIRLFTKFFGVVFAALFAVPLSLILGPLFLNNWFNQASLLYFFSNHTPLGKLASAIIAGFVSNTGGIIVSFLILLMGVPIVSFVIRMILKFFRQHKGFAIFDGFLGLFGMFIMYFVILFMIFLSFRIIIDFNGLDYLTQFLISDMRLETNQFSISRFLFNNSVLDFFFTLIVS